MGYEDIWRNMTFDQALTHLARIQRESLATLRILPPLSGERAVANRRFDRAASYDSSIRRIMSYLSDVEPPGGILDEACGICGIAVALASDHIWLCPAELPVKSHGWAPSFVTEKMRAATPNVYSDCAEDYGGTLCYPHVPVHVVCHEKELEQA